MEKIGTFVNIKQNDLLFNGCSSCEGNCCNGAKGFSLSSLILEDFEEVYENFAIAFTIKERKLIACVLLNNGTDYCKYYKDNQCSIYEQRTPACKLYPISPYLDEVLVDTQCPSINKEVGKIVSQNGKLSDDFYTQRLENFHEKLLKTNQFYDSIFDMNNFALMGQISGLPLLHYNKPSDNKYIQMHLKSLKHYEN